MYIMHNIQKQDKKFYGAVTIGERGQIVLPAQARKDYGFKTGQKLIMLGDKHGVAVIGVEHLIALLDDSADLRELVNDNIKER